MATSYTDYTQFAQVPASVKSGTNGDQIYTIETTLTQTSGSNGTLSVRFHSIGSWDWYANNHNSLHADVYINNTRIGGITVQQNISGYTYVGLSGAGLSGVLDSDTASFSVTNLTTSTQLQVVAVANISVTSRSGNFILSSADETYTHTFTVATAPVLSGISNNNPHPNNTSISASTDSIRVKLVHSGDISAYYFKIDNGSWNSHNGDTYTFTGLSTNTSHTISAYLSGPGGTSETKTVTLSTRKAAIISSVVNSNKLTVSGTTYDGVSAATNSIQVTANQGTGSITEHYLFRYKTSTATDYGTWQTHNGATYTFTNLTANTTYNIQAKVTNDQTESSVVSVTIRTKKNAPSITTLKLDNPKSSGSSTSDSETQMKIAYAFANQTSSSLSYQLKNSTESTYGTSKTVTGTSPITITNAAAQADSRTDMIFTATASNSDYATAATRSITVHTLYNKPTLSISETHGATSVTWTITPSRSGIISYSTDDGSTWTALSETDSTDSQTLTLIGTPGSTKSCIFRMISATATDSRESDHYSESVTLYGYNTIVLQQKYPFAAPINFTGVNTSGNYGKIEIRYSTYDAAYNAIAATIFIPKSTPGSSYNVSWTPDDSVIDALYKLMPVSANSISCWIAIYTGNDNLTEETYESSTNYYTENYTPGDPVRPFEITKSSVIKTAKVSVNGEIKRCRVWVGDSDNVPRPAIMYVSVDGTKKRTI